MKTIKIDIANGTIIIQDSNDIHNEVLHPCQGKGYSGEFPEVGSLSKIPEDLNTETEIERGRLRLLHQDCKRVELAVQELKVNNGKRSKMFEERLQGVLQRRVENLLNTLLVLGYLPREQ